MNEKCTTDQDNGRLVAERHKEQPVQQRMYAITALFSAGKELTILFKQYDNSI